MLGPKLQYAENTELLLSRGMGEVKVFTAYAGLNRTIVKSFDSVRPGGIP
jgi:hypothetical protein